MTNFEGIKKGDRVRMVYEVTAVYVGEDRQYLRTDENVYYAYEGESELVSVEKLEQPLPTEDGWYESEQYPLRDGYGPYLLRDGSWYNYRNEPSVKMEKKTPLHKLSRISD